VEQQSHIKKINEVRLITKLTQVGVPGEKLETMDRQAMMNMWAEFVASGKDKPVTAPVVFNPVGYYPEIEKKDWNSRCGSMKMRRKGRRLN
jgi:hypothetical protein